LAAAAERVTIQHTAAKPLPSTTPAGQGESRHKFSEAPPLQVRGMAQQRAPFREKVCAAGPRLAGLEGYPQSALLIHAEVGTRVGFRAELDTRYAESVTEAFAAFAEIGTRLAVVHAEFVTLPIEAYKPFC
jgi:hypothetical protein